MTEEDVPDGQPNGCTDIQLSSPMNGASGLEPEGPRGLFGLWSSLFGCSSSCPRGKACAKEVQNLPVQPDRCPFGHGSVGAAPYPNYVHGARGGLVCPAGCVPKMEMRRGTHTSETPHQALVREMIEYQELYHRERGNSEATKQARVDEILQEISETGTYNLTHDELEHGARVAWRNAPKCANRKFWEMLSVMDFRHVRTNQEMFQACLELCEKAIMDGAATTNVGIFRAQTPGTKDGPRIWNSQLYRFAYHKASGLGDPAEEEFTELVKSWGWKPSEETNFDILPLVCQMDPQQAPEMFEIPKHYQFTVAIEHPEPSHDAISDMGLRWYGVPIVSNMDFSIGGLLFTAAPFNGWYSVTEIIRNYTDEGRYNLCKPVAEKMGYDTLSNASMYKDQVVVDLTKAILHSFRRQGTAIVDHHTLLEQFFVWYNKERQKRGYVPGNWKWIIPPIGAHLTPSYLQLNKMTEYTLTPALFYAPGSSVYYQEYLARTKSADEPEDEEKRQESEFKTKDEKAQITIIYATTAGTSKKYAQHLVQTLSGIFKVALLNVEDFEDEPFCAAIEKSVFFILVSSTYGAGFAFRGCSRASQLPGSVLSGPWKDWFETGVSAPDTHPLKLLLNDPQLAKYIWSSTTCGGQMSGMALQARDDLEQLQGSATFEDWTDTLALVMSRSVIEDRDERPLLIIGLDLLQAAEDPVIKLELNYGKEGAVMGLGGQGPEKLLGIKVKAVEDIEAGMELTMAYLAKPHAGGYLERYGFVPNWLRGELAESAMQLSISPVDDEDDFLGVKESCLEDLGLTTAPLSFTFSLSDGILAPRETDEWERKSELEKMVQVLRFQTCGGTDSFLLDAVYVERFWYNCNFRLSRNNEILVCQQAMTECDRWLDRFDALEATGTSPDSPLARAADDIRRAERDLLQSVKLVFEQELDLIQIDDTIRYWADRAMDEAFPDRMSKNVQGY